MAVATSGLCFFRSVEKMADSPGLHFLCFALTGDFDGATLRAAFILVALAAAKREIGVGIRVFLQIAKIPRRSGFVYSTNGALFRWSAMRLSGRREREVCCRSTLCKRGEHPNEEQALRNAGLPRNFAHLAILGRPAIYSFPRADNLWESEARVRHSLLLERDNLAVQTEYAVELNTSQVAIAHRCLVGDKWYLLHS